MFKRQKIGGYHHFQKGIGIGMEYYQKYYVPSRGFDVLDMLADAIGALCALPLFELVGKKLFK